MLFKRKTRKEETQHEVSLEYSIANYDPKRRIRFSDEPQDPNQVEEAGNFSREVEKELLERGLELIPDSDPYNPTPPSQYSDGNVTATMSRFRDVRDNRKFGGHVLDSYSFQVKIASTDQTRVLDLSSHLQGKFPKLEEID